MKLFRPLIFGVVAGVLAIGGCGEAEEQGEQGPPETVVETVEVTREVTVVEEVTVPAPEPEAPAAAPGEPDPSGPPTVPVGESFQFRTFEVVVSNPRIEEQRTDVILEEPVQGPFLVVDMAVTNTSQDYTSINPFDLTLYTDQTSTDIGFQDTVPTEQDPFQEVAPGVTREGVVAAPFPPEQTPMYIGFSTGLTEEVRVELSLS